MAIVAPWSRALCPFCFETFHLSDAPRRRTSGAKKPDNNVKRYFSLAIPPDMHVAEPAPAERGLFWKIYHSVFVPDDWNGDVKKICPNCHLFLPHATACGALASEAIAIIGDRGSGKSNYFGVLLRELETRYAAEVGFTMYDQETFFVQEMRSIHSAGLYARRYGRLFDRIGPRMAIDQTLSSKTVGNEDLRIPLIYRLEFPPRMIDYVLRPFSPRRALDLVIFDAAGEDMRDDNPDTLDSFYRYIAAASGIIFLIDPVQCDGIRARLDGDLQRRFPRETIDQAEIVSRVINLFQRRHGLKPGQQLRVPIAFAFAKSDLFRDLVDPSARLHRDSRHEGGFDESDCRQLSDEMASYLKKWGSTRLLQLAQDKVKTSAFFALSALGQTPEEGTLRIRPVEPKRVADPLLWLLKQRGYIPATA
jgi:hypothetical protein